jgi:hypothetical protein
MTPNQSTENMTMRIINHVLHEIKMAFILFSSAFPEPPAVQGPKPPRRLSHALAGGRHQPMPHGAKPNGQ